MREADALEAEVWDGLVKQNRSDVARREALARIDRALGLREAAQGPEHADLIALNRVVRNRELDPRIWGGVHFAAQRSGE